MIAEEVEAQEAEELTVSNVCFLALSGRCAVTSLTTAPSQKEKFTGVEIRPYRGLKSTQSRPKRSEASVLAL